MNKLSYCVDCKKIFNSATECAGCNSTNTKELRKNSPVNVVGSKLKGRVLRNNASNVTLLINDENNNQYVKDYEADSLRKIL